ncbi:MAG: BCD family MFS transporter, partial [Oscillochloris sp.]|nr:BCD family MFS transporter [Oscillochloris sp.]
MRILHYIRLAGFPLGLGLTSALVGGTLNRVMIVELSLPASLIGLLFSLPLLISPLRVWLGYHSDSHTIWGLRREPYIILGMLFATLAVIAITLAVFNLQMLSLWMILAVGLGFLAYGMGKNLASNTFEALLADTFVGDQRPRAVTLFKVAMFVGIIGGAIALGRMLDPFSPVALTTIVVGLMTTVAVITAIGTFGQEPRSHALQQACAESRATPFVETIKTVILPDPQVRIFFIVVMLTILGTLAQDLLLEPYGALALEMTVGQTARLTAIWGSGTIVAMAISGIWLVKRFGYRAIMRVGLLVGALVFLGLILAGVLKNPALFMGLVFVLGISTGLSSAGLLTAVIEFTTPARAGLLMGVWGLAHELGQAAGNLMGGGVVDIMRALTNNSALLSYGAVFLLEAGLLGAALLLLQKMDLSQSAALKADDLPA